MDNVNLEKLVRPIIKSIKSYSSARNEFYNLDEDKIFMDANENPYKNDVNRYPDPFQVKLKKSIASLKLINSDQILLGNGSDEILDIIIRTFCEPNKDEVILLPPTYGMYEVLSNINQSIIRKVRLNDEFELNLDLIFNNISNKTKIIFICSPNNPTGNALPIDQIISILDNFFGIVVLDEAYIDFSESESLIGLIKKYPNLIICQTFSKAYGMAGIRLGMCFANSIFIDYFNKIKPPYNVNSLTQDRALKLLESPEKINNGINEILEERKKIEKQLMKFKFIKKIFPSDANFLLIMVDNAEKRYDQFLSKGVVLRNRSHLIGCENTLRVTIGTPKENTKFINICKEIDV